MLTFSVLLVLCAYAFADHHEHHYAAGPFRSLRKAASDMAPQSRSVSDTPEAARCIAPCAQKYAEDMKKEAPGTEGNEPAEVDPAKLEKLCQINDKAKTCYEKCPNGQFKDMMKKLTAMYQFMCHESTFKQNAQCINEVHKSTKDSCKGPSKCGPKMEQLMKCDQNKPTNEDTLKGCLKAACGLMDCKVECMKPTLVEKCTQNAYNDVKGVNKKTKELLKFDMELDGFGHLWPQECNA